MEYSDESQRQGLGSYDSWHGRIVSSHLRLLCRQITRRGTEDAMNADAARTVAIEETLTVYLVRAAQLSSDSAS